MEQPTAQNLAPQDTPDEAPKVQPTAPVSKPAEATKVQVTHAPPAPRKPTGKYHYAGDQPTHLPGGPEIQPGLNDFSGYTDPEVLERLAGAVESGLLKPA
jgi:hypothetical protein